LTTYQVFSRDYHTSRLRQATNQEDEGIGIADDGISLQLHETRHHICTRASTAHGAVDCLLVALLGDHREEEWHRASP
jgi:hypothetical protein